MKSLVKLYDKALEWSQHKHAPRYLAAVSFVEASVFPIPPYFMLAPMALAKPDRAIRYALIATIASVLGGLVGYLLGYLVFQPLVMPLIDYFSLEQSFDIVTARLQEHGFSAVLVAGFLPVPFKIVAIAAGFMQVPVSYFILAALVGRSVKFFAVALLMKFGGSGMENYIRDMIAKSGIIFLILTAAFVGYKCLS